MLFRYFFVDTKTQDISLATALTCVIMYTVYAHLIFTTFVYIYIYILQLQCCRVQIRLKSFLRDYLCQTAISQNDFCRLSRQNDRNSPYSHVQFQQIYIYMYIYLDREALGGYAVIMFFRSYYYYFHGHTYLYITRMYVCGVVRGPKVVYPHSFALFVFQRPQIEQCIH